MTVLGHEGNDQTVGVVVDVSRTGLRLRTPTAVPTIGGVFLRINVGNEVHEVKASIRRVTKLEEGGYDVGLAFARAEDEGRLNFLKAFLQTKQTRKGKARSGPS